MAVRVRVTALSALIQMDRAVAGADGEGLPAAVQLALYSRRTEGSFDGDRQAQADVTVMCTGFDVGLQITRDFEVDAAVSGADGPGGVHA